MNQRAHFLIAVTFILSPIATLLFPFDTRAPQPASLASTTEIVSLASDGTQANGASSSPSISADGRFVAFASSASNLVNGDTNGKDDIFVRDLRMGVTERVSIASNGAQGNDISYVPSISADGRFVAFTSLASNLVNGDTNGKEDVFVRDRRLEITEQISVASDGAPGNDLSFYSFITPDGRYVAFSSFASNLVSDDTNNTWDVFIHDRYTGVTERVPVGSEKSRGYFMDANVSLSADGRQVVFDSWADDLVDGDTNDTKDVFLYDRLTKVTERVSVAWNGMQGNLMSFSPFISADGRFVVFASLASNLISGDTGDGVPFDQDIFLHDLQTGGNVEIEGDFMSDFPSISVDDRFVVFDSSVRLMAPEGLHLKSNVYLYDRQIEETELVSVPLDDTQWDESSSSASVSADGRFVAFSSEAANLVRADTNEQPDIFLRDRCPDGYCGFEPKPAIDMAAVLREARVDLGMPFHIDRGCLFPFLVCGGKFHGFYRGVNTDLVLDAYRYGSLFYIHSALEHDQESSPARYKYGTARNAGDMLAYFKGRQQFLANDQPYQVGDIAFFDWEDDGIVDHVALVTAVNSKGGPLLIAEATGVFKENLNGLAYEHLWTEDYAGHVQGHGRINLNRSSSLEPGEDYSALVIRMEPADVSMRVRDSSGRQVAADLDENLVASNVEAFIPYIPRSQIIENRRSKAVTIYNPLANAQEYSIELTSQRDITCQLRMETSKGGVIQEKLEFTEKIGPGETRLLKIRMDPALGLDVGTAALAPRVEAPRTVILAGPARTLGTIKFYIVEQSGLQAVEGGLLKLSDLKNQMGNTIWSNLLKVTPTSFSMAAGSTQEVTVESDLSLVPNGAYFGNLTLTANNISPVRIPLILEVYSPRTFLPLSLR